jgi:CheY-like chemotaxis protein
MACNHKERDIRFVVVSIGRGARRRPRWLDSAHHVLKLDGNGLTRQNALHAVAIAAGLETLHEEAPVVGKTMEAIAPPTRAQALEQGRLILVAEDNDTNQKVIVRQLAVLGFAADVATNGSIALQRWHSGDYALLLTDLHMPVMDGFELAASIRSHEGEVRHIPIIAISANALLGGAQRCQEAGMDGYLTKPTPLAELEEMLHKWLPIKAPDMESVAVGERAIHSTKEPVDVSVLAALIGDDQALLDEFLIDFQASASAIALALNAACATANMAQAGALAHKLKSSARSVGALKLGALCAQLEAAGLAGDGPALDLLMRSFANEMAAVDAAITSITTRVEGKE